MSARVAGKRILLSTIGSLGDLHPMLALGLELKWRGHSVTVASTAYYRDKVEELGLGFCGVRPDWDPTDQQLIARCEDLRSGPEVLFRELVLPHLKATYEDLLAAAVNTDLMIAGELVFAAPLVAEKLGSRWVSATLSPTSFFSAHDPSLLVNMPEIYWLRGAGWLVNRGVLELGKLATRHWWKPVRDLRQELGLRVECDPIFKDKFSRDLVLALFSPMLAEPQPDWPAQTLQPGFAWFDRAKESESSQDHLHRFLDNGEPPVVFTLGSAAVNHPGSFFAESLRAARQLRRRAVLLGPKPDLESQGPDVLVLPYAPYSEVFPRAAAIVHQGGSGTTGQALRAGRPQLIVPYGWDQPDNGARVARLGAGMWVARRHYAGQVVNVLGRLLTEGRFAETAEKAGSRIRAENGLSSACDAIEAML